MTNTVSLGKIDISSLRKKFADYADVLEKELQKELFAVATDIKADAVTSILTGAKTGRTYTVGTVTRQASAAGQAPANQTRSLSGSIRVNTVDVATVQVIAGGVADADEEKIDYAAHLEFGTRNMLPRPYMHPAFKKNEKKLEGAVTKAAKRASAKIAKK